MTSQADIEIKFWKALRSDKTLMLGLADTEASLAQPMTAQFDSEDSTGPIWFFAAKSADLVRSINGAHHAVAHFTAKGHDLFASVEGELSLSSDRAVIDRLWNPFVAAWFEGGKDDPNLALLRFDPERAQIWLNDSSLLAGVRIMLGRDPKKDYADKTAEVRM